MINSSSSLRSISFTSGVQMSGATVIPAKSTRTNAGEAIRTDVMPEDAAYMRNRFDDEYAAVDAARNRREKLIKQNLDTTTSTRENLEGFAPSDGCLTSRCQSPMARETAMRLFRYPSFTCPLAACESSGPHETIANQRCDHTAEANRRRRHALRTVSEEPQNPHARTTTIVGVSEAQHRTAPVQVASTAGKAPGPVCESHTPLFSSSRPRTTACGPSTSQSPSRAGP